MVDTEVTSAADADAAGLLGTGAFARATGDDVMEGTWSINSRPAWHVSKRTDSIRADNDDTEPRSRSHAAPSSTASPRKLKELLQRPPTFAEFAADVVSGE